MKKINDKDVEKFLRRTITEALGGPGGDPDKTHMTIGAMAYQALQHFGFNVSKYNTGDDDTFKFLSGENIYNCNFLDVIDWKGSYKNVK